jgi:lipoprotein-anchoring transpeptidase ErfK/SrfK
MLPMSLIRRLTAASLVATIASSCSLTEPEPAPQAGPLLYQWDDDNGPGDLSVEIDLSTQKATYHRGDRPIGWSYVSTGKSGRPTPTGDFTMTQLEPVRHSDRYGWITDTEGNVSNSDATPRTPVPDGHTYHPSPMFQWMRITSYGIGLHAGEIPEPGVAASHGCIRLPRDLAPKIYAAAKIGTPVKIVARSRKPRPTPTSLT